MVTEKLTVVVVVCFFLQTCAGHHVHVSNPHAERLERSDAPYHVGDRRNVCTSRRNLFHFLSFVCDAGEYVTIVMLLTVMIMVVDVVMLCDTTLCQQW